MMKEEERNVQHCAFYILCNTTVSLCVNQL